MSDEVASWRRELAARWVLLSGKPISQGGIVTAALPATTGGGVVLAGIGADGDRHLLLPIEWGSEVAEDTRATHVRVERRELVFEGVTGLYADVVCRRPDLAGLFDDVLAEILTRLEERPTGRPDAVSAAVLDAWRELLRRRGGRLSESAMRGLFGELIVLERVLEGSHGVESWMGPYGEPHDFHLADGDLEVKTLGLIGAEVEIHGIRQLEPPPGGELHLILVRLAAAREGRSLPDLVEHIRGLAIGRAAFDDRLAAVGYSDEAAEEFRDRPFIVAQISALRVGDAFPRLTPAELVRGLPEQITALSYTLDLSAALPHALLGPALTPLFAKGKA